MSPTARKSIQRRLPGRNKLLGPARTVAILGTFSTIRPQLAIILGSGFQLQAQDLVDATEIAYSRLPGFPVPSVRGHAGKAIIGKLSGEPVLVLSGRGHYYEGYSMQAVTFPIRVLAGFGIRDVLLTNAAGGINARFRPGDFMLVRDHINFMPDNPLRGWAGEQTRFIDMTQAYDLKLRRAVQQAAKQTKVRLKTGVYLAVPGPSYETPAEIRAFSRLGADAVGMSTVPEVIVARQCGLAVAALSCITNLAAGRSSTPLSHSEVLAVAKGMAFKAKELLRAFVEEYAKLQR